MSVLDVFQLLMYSSCRGIARPSQGCGLLRSFPQLLKAVQKGYYRCVVRIRDGMGKILF